VKFEWDPKKAQANLDKHRVSFEEASTIFGNPLAATVPDPLHSDEELRFITMGRGQSAAFSSWRTQSEATASGSSVPAWPRRPRESDMGSRVHVENGDEMLPEYDFSGAVRGKYYDRYQKGTNVVLLDADVAEVFPDAASVNEALRLLVALADAKASRTQTTARRPKSRRKSAPRSPQTRAARGRE
jgi:uncharacterized DUF497 family protein